MFSFNDSDGEEEVDNTCTVCLRNTFSELVEPIKTSCPGSGHNFCWYGDLLALNCVFYVLFVGHVSFCMSKPRWTMSVQTVG